MRFADWNSTRSPARCHVPFPLQFNISPHRRRLRPDRARTTPLFRVSQDSSSSWSVCPQASVQTVQASGVTLTCWFSIHLSGRRFMGFGRVLILPIQASKPRSGTG